MGTTDRGFGRRAFLLALILALGGVALAPGRHMLSAAPERRPDIILWLLDDFSPLPRRLWTDAALVPDIAQFSLHGVTFEQAIATTPLCGPSRATLLTGRYGHNNGMTQNDVRDLRGVAQIAARMQDAGYRTAYLGRDINGTFLKYRTQSAMRNKARDWNRYEVIWRSDDKNYGWQQFRKTGPRSSRVVTFGHDEMDMSTAVAATRAAQHIRATPRDKPLFMVISLVDGHKPLTPLRRFEGDRDCAAVEPWAGPAYMEKDVSDKPAYVQALSRTALGGHDLAARCEVLRTSDWAIGTVRRALAERNRLSNAFQLITADNGWLMGDHRIVGKSHAYATPVPMYVRWPRQLRGHARTVRDKVAIVDLPRTFCALAGCSMPRQDGRNLLPLIKGRKQRLDRSFLATEMLHAARDYGEAAGARPAWAGIETTLKYDDHLWAYTRYQTGEEELYDLTDDPHRLRNLAADPAHAGRLQGLRRFYWKTWNEEGMRWLPRLP